MNEEGPQRNFCRYIYILQTAWLKVHGGPSLYWIWVLSFIYTKCFLLWAFFRMHDWRAFVSIFRASNAFSVFKTNLSSLELISLQSIKNGKISLYGNTDLCFIDSTDFTQLFTFQKNQGQEFKIKDYVRSRDNRPAEDCST